MDFEQHSVIRGLFPNKLTFHIVYSGSSDHDHAATEENLSQEDGYQNVGVLSHLLLLTLLIIIVIVF